MDKDSDLIAYLSCVDNQALVKRLICEYNGVVENSEEEEYRRDSREATASLSGDEASQSLVSMELRFSRGPKAEHGFVFGASPSCDFVLNAKGISNRHFAITFDNVGRLIVRDLHSANGLAVTYNGKAKEIRKDGFHWIIGGDTILEGVHIEICPTPSKTRQSRTAIVIIVQSAISLDDPGHLERVATFLHDTAPLEQRFDDQVLSEVPTALATQTASADLLSSIYFPLQEISFGGFGTVRRVWNVSTGQMCARKKPIQRQLKPSQIKMWVRELNCMKNAVHHHIVPLLDSTMDPVPTIVMELYALGNLKDQTRSFTRNESIQVLEQCLDALKYIHSIKMAHRDISPSNILVRGRSETYDDIDVVLSDFGLSKEGSDFVTFCGTLAYQAPEVVCPIKPKPGASSNYKEEDKYTCAVDLWSLGVVVLQIAFGLPDDVDPANPTAWMHRLVLEVTKWDRISGLGHILTLMIVIDPEARITSCNCFALARDLALFGEEPSYNSQVSSNEAVTATHSFLYPGEGGLQNSNHLNRVNFRRSNAPEPSFESSDQSVPLSAVADCHQQLYADEYQQDQGRYDTTDAAYTVRRPTLGLNHNPGQQYEYNARSPASRTSQWLPSLCSDNDPYMVQGGMGYARELHGGGNHGRFGGTTRQWYVGQTVESTGASQDSSSYHHPRVTTPL
ncbi:hypothetical protein MCOR29_009620 [Pyricularia oryzae]|uniref:non-specific serine/threonine protein kinase n=2 Tax=Pyricularia TaxID=48558 RepID=A0ABQ8N7L9_PYRGI|nr:hypothetical protein MCOR33_009737 [Pyricularia grisea]KAI6307558.1 hypothetical protein MCOR29_009620 [Pyricularia oryzae]KAI6360473.1 hypothetical protein MCOR31_009069 [Pyricularia oryzae]KAI6383840.1 hypothetical protein MCOR32_002512 [Pyricularia oryzae]KAI6402925.1 hypothetical protein MCOR20_007508 [Pyricularia oryzae]